MLKKPTRLFQFNVALCDFRLLGNFLMKQTNTEYECDMFVNVILKAHSQTD